MHKNLFFIGLLPVKYYAIVIVGLALALQWYSHSSGLIFTDDSHHYVAGSVSFKSSMTLVDKDGHRFLFWPPLFPVILSLLGSPERALVWINLFLEVCIAIVLLKIICRIINNPAFQVICFAFILWGVHLLLITTFLWSELVFLCLILIFVHQLQRSKENISAFYFAIIFGFLMCLQRNSGLFITTGATIWLFVNEDTIRKKFLRSSFFFLSVNSGLLMWSFYVWLIQPREHFNFSVDLFQHAFQNTNSIAQAIIKTFVPIDFLSIPLLIIFLVILSVVLKKELLDNRDFQLIFIVTISYLIFLILVVVINILGIPVDFSEGDRLISVIAPFLSILCFKLLEKIYTNQPSKIKKIILMLIILWMIYPISRTINNAILWNEMSTAKLSFDEL